jgi:hypothetical protein
MFSTKCPTCGRASGSECVGDGMVAVVDGKTTYHVHPSRERVTPRIRIAVKRPSRKRRAK